MIQNAGLILIHLLVQIVIIIARAGGVENDKASERKRNEQSRDNKRIRYIQKYSKQNAKENRDSCQKERKHEIKT